MKNGFLFAATGAMFLMFVSCSADEPVEKNTTYERIDYTVVTANQSRAAHSYCSNNKPEGFKVWAKYGDGTSRELYIDGDDIQKSGDKYVDVTGPRFWPRDNNNPTNYYPLSFYAVVDKYFAKNESLFDNSGQLVPFSYTVDSDITKQLDLMYAVKIGATYDAATSSAVALNFRHALSQVCFRARNESPTNRITIKGVSIGGLYDTGTYTLPTASTDASINDHDVEPAPASTNRGAWTIAADALKSASYEIPVGADGNGVLLDATVKDLTVQFTEDHQNMNWSGMLNLLPQKRPAAAIASTADDLAPGSDGAYIKLTLQVENIGKVTATDTDPYDPVNKPNIVLYLGVNIDWKEGNRYIYTFNFGKDFSHAKLAAVTYSVSSDDFNQLDLNPIINGHAAVLMREAAKDMPALYVATKNIGATKPDDSGHYFWWGDLTGKPRGYEYTDPDFKFSATNSEISTHGKTIQQLKEDGWLDNNGNLTLAHDVAHVQWGGPWHMPTKSELEWLIRNCQWTKVMSENDKFLGFKVVSNTTGGEIYFPNSEWYGKTSDYDNTPDTDKTSNENSFYWTSTVKDDKNSFYYYYLKEATQPGISASERYFGYPIRGVANTTEAAPATE